MRGCANPCKFCEGPFARCVHFCLQIQSQSLHRIHHELRVPCWIQSGTKTKHFGGRHERMKHRLFGNVANVFADLSSSIGFHAIDKDFPFIRHQCVKKNAEQRGFTRTIFTEQSNRFPMIDTAVDGSQDRFPAKRFGKSADSNRRIICRHLLLPPSLPELRAGHPSRTDRLSG